MIVTESFANLALAIEPVKLSAAKLPLNVVAVTAPETHTSVAVTNPTVVIPLLILNEVPTILPNIISGVPVKPDALVAVSALPVTSPVKSPLNVVAEHIPDTCKVSVSTCPVTSIPSVVVFIFSVP